MTWNAFSQRCLRLFVTGRKSGSAAVRRFGSRLVLEQLEDRMLLTNYTASTSSELIADINAANKAGGTNTITLATHGNFVYWAPYSTSDGSGNALPVIAANDNLTIIGNGNSIRRITPRGVGEFIRFFSVAAGASLTLENMGLYGGAVIGRGGAIDNHGTLVLNGVTVEHNSAEGWQSAGAGGAIYSSGSLTLEGGTLIENNEVSGPYESGTGVNCFGGGVYVAAGTVTVTDTTLSANTALGGRGDIGGNGLGGGMYVAGGTVILRDDTLTSNSAQGGLGGASGHAGLGEGGALFIDPVALVYLDAFTQAHVTSNTASTSDPNIHGPWKPL
jgi:hypothetical protein